MQTNKPLPSAIDAEQAILASILIDPLCLVDVAETIRADIFQGQANAAVYRAIIELAAEGKPYDSISVANKLESQGNLDRLPGGKAYIHTIVNGLLSTANIEPNAELIVNKYIFREFIKQMSACVVAAYTAEDATELLDAASGIIYELADKTQSRKAVELGELIKSTDRDIREIYNQEFVDYGYDLGFPEIDQVLTGIYPGDLIVVGARSRVGKTAFMLNIATNMLAQRIPVIIFSLEMTAKQLMYRLYTAKAEVNNDYLRNKYVKMPGEIFESLKAASKFFNDKPLHIDDSPSTGIVNIQTKARRFFAKAETAGVIFIDYVQQIREAGNSENEQVRISKITSALKVMAKELKCPVVALAQLNREIEKRQEKIPQLADLRSSGSLEMDSDIVILLHRDVNNESLEERAKTIINIAKHRKGDGGLYKLKYKEQYTKFVEDENVNPF